MSKPADPSRRKFVTSVSLATAGFAIVPRHVLGRGFTAPSDTLNIAGVGVGGMGRQNLINLSSQNVVAMCDVDWDAGKSMEQLDTGSRRFRRGSTTMINSGRRSRLVRRERRR
jgi:hypothetical protein